MKKIAFLLCICSFSANAQTDSLKAREEIVAFQKKLNDEYKNRGESPLDANAFATFKGHDYFPINLAYRVVAKLEVTPSTPFFSMKTTSSRFSTERIYGYVHFTLVGKEFRLPVYQSKDLMQTAEYADYLFFPFADLTSGSETYPAGRYLDLDLTRTGIYLVDFNRAYNPYCYYNPTYDCPYPPRSNRLQVPIRAGEKVK